jgi:uncharacterized protein YcfJ
MKLYVICPTTNRRIYLSLIVERRSQIYSVFTIQCPYDRQVHSFRREDVRAEPTLGGSIGGAIIGALIGGLLGGPLGLILGGGAGLMFGSNVDEEERRRVRRFYGELL